MMRQLVWYDTETRLGNNLSCTTEAKESFSAYHRST